MRVAACREYDPMTAEIDIKTDAVGLAPLAQPAPEQGWLRPHRIVLIAIALALIVTMAMTMRWDWIPTYADDLLMGLWRTVWLLAASVVLGFLLAVPLGL